MPKLSEFWSNETPWDSNLTDFVGQVLLIRDVEETTSKYGRGYLVDCSVVEDGEVMDNVHKAVTSNTVIVDQLDHLRKGHTREHPAFPIILRLIKVRGKDQSYFQFEDVD
jgi:hypothetical protein